MSEKPATSDATIQMTPEDVARLHRQLAGQGTIAPEAAAVTVEEPDELDDDELEVDPMELPTTRARVPDLGAPPPALAASPKPAAKPAAPAAKAPAPVARPSVAAPAVRAQRPSTAAPAVADHASVPVMVGAIGMFLALAGLVLLFLPQLQGMGRDTEGPGLLAFGVAHVFVAVGFFAAATRTSGVAILVGIFALLVALTFCAAFLLHARIIADSLDLAKPLFAAVLVMPGLTWLLAGIWGFVGLKPLAPGFGIPAGIFGLLGGLAGAGGGVLLLTGMPEGGGPDDDLHVLLGMVAYGGIALAMLTTAIGFIARVARAPKLS